MANGQPDFDGLGAGDPQPGGAPAAAAAPAAALPGTAPAAAAGTEPVPGDPGYSYSGSEEATEPYRNKAVINQRGATVEINNSTDREELKLSQYSGSNITLNNNVNSELALRWPYE